MFDRLARREFLGFGSVFPLIAGADPATLPVEEPTQFELAINLKAAKQIGLTIPVRVLERANKVIK